MKLASQKLCLAAATSAFALLLAGCPHKPDRPAPSQTVLGPQTGGQNITPMPTPVENTAGLLPRETDMFDPNGQNRTALQAQTVFFDLNQSDIKPAEREKLKAAKE